jgi:predicted nucleic acid-binding protein
LIIDASVAFKWLIDEPGSEAAVEWIGKTSLLAPKLVISDVGNALSKRVRRSEIEGARAGEMLSNLISILDYVDEAPHMERALALSVALNHSVYDCVYLALAEALGEPLLTADQKFAAKLGNLARHVELLET